jgi:addiction module RelE/StbE family toxin
LAQIVYSNQALADLERLTDFLLETGALAAAETATLITEAIQILANHSLIGRPAEHDMRELVISRGITGYLALYDYVEGDDIVLVLAIRHHREVGYNVE